MYGAPPAHTWAALAVPVGCAGGVISEFYTIFGRNALICVLICCGCPIWALVGSHLHQEVCVRFCMFLCVCVCSLAVGLQERLWTSDLRRCISQGAYATHFGLVVRSARLAGVQFEHVSGAQFWHASALSGRLAGGQSKRQERNLLPQLGRPPLRRV